MKIIYVDIDETICETSNSRDYTTAKPIVENIKKYSVYEMNTT